MEGAPAGSASEPGAPRDRATDGSPGRPTRPNARGRRWCCCTSGHEELPAACLGIFDDGEEAYDQTPYCGECAQALIRTGEYRVTEVLDADRLGTSICPTCAGTGRLPFIWAGEA